MATFGLTLGGGGARGSAHVGVLLEMERLDLEPDLVTGTSIGGIIGALLAAGLDVDTITDFMTDLSLLNAFALPRKPSSLVDNKRLENLLVKAIGRPKFSDLKLPLSLVASGLRQQNQVVINCGDVISAVLATSAIPAILPPVEYGDELLVDGGVVNNTPYEIATEMGASKVLAVDLSHAAPYGSKPESVKAGNFIERALSSAMSYPSVSILLATLDLVQAQVLEAQLAIQQPDVLLRPYLGTIGFLDFHRLQEGIETGRKAFLSAENEIIEKFK